MKATLSARLVSQKLIGPDSLIYCNCIVIGLGQLPQQVQKELILIEAHPTKFICRDKIGRRYTVFVEDILEIDGMSPERFAAAYDITPEGTNKVIGKKRGRKPKLILGEQHIGH